MKTQKNSRISKTRRGKLKTVLFIIVLLLFIFSIYFVMDKIKRSNTNRAMQKTLAALKKDGFSTFDQSSSCGKTQVKYGDGAKVCTIYISGSVNFSNGKSHKNNSDLVKSVNKKNKSFYKTIESTNLYIRKGDIPEIHRPVEGFSFGSRFHRLKSTGGSCSAHTDYDWDNSNLRLAFYCRNTGWFDRIFHNGQFSF